MPEINELIPATPPENSWSIKMLCQEGSSNKVYHMKMIRLGDLFAVECLYGPNGGTLKSESKTRGVPVPFRDAVGLVKAVLKDKLNPRKGYQVVNADGADVPAYERPEDTGLRPMLLQAVDIDDAAQIQSLINNPKYVAQEKHDGHRRLIVVTNGGDIYGTNRSGVRLPLSGVIKNEMKECDAGVYDGEQIGDTVVLWDMLDHSGKNLTGLPYFQRLAHLQAAVDLPEDMYFAGAGDISSIDESNSVLRIVKTARTAAEKAALFKYLKDNDKEGTTFKDIHAPYESGGRSESAIKVKFWETLSAVVTMVNTKRSVGLQLFEDDGEVVYVGNVSIPVNQDIPNPGDVVEVRYLYAHKQGSLFEPTYLGPRSDIRASECLASQRKFKPDAKPASGMKIS